MSLPRLQKIVVNMGVGSAITEKKHMEDAVAALTQITGQKPLVTKSRKAIANFKLREEHADRLQGDAARPADVRVPRPADFAGAAARPRLPRAEPQRVRRPRQLQPGPDRAVGVSGVEPGQVHCDRRA